MQPETTPDPSGGAGAGVARSPAGRPARAWWGDRMVASTSAAVRVEEEGRPPALYFPPADVRVDLLRDDDRRVSCPVKGGARLWSLDGADGSGHRAGAGAPGSGEDAAWSFDAPSPACPWLSGLIAFDHDRVRVELLDGDADGDRGATTVRFPTWGDAAHLVDLLDVHPDGERSFLTSARADWRRPVVEGSQMLGQAIVAAGRHTGGRRVVSAHMVFARTADARRPLRIDLDELSHGRTFTALNVTVGHDGRRCAAGTLLLDVRAPSVLTHAEPAPDVPGPLDCPPVDMAVTGRDVRVVDGAYTGDPDAPVGPPVIDAWVRVRDVPGDPVLHAGLLTQFTGHLPIAAAFRPHPGVGQDQAHRSLSTAINAIAISLHAEPRADRWLLYRHRSTFAGDGMTHAECRVHDEDGRLVASFAVDAMVRTFAGRAPAAGDRTAL